MHGQHQHKHLLEAIHQLHLTKVNEGSSGQIKGGGLSLGSLLINGVSNFRNNINIDQGWGQALNINSNQIWKSPGTYGNTLYLQYSNPNGNVQIGKVGSNNGLVVQGNVDSSSISTKYIQATKQINAATIATNSLKVGSGPALTSLSGRVVAGGTQRVKNTWHCTNLWGGAGCFGKYYYNPGGVSCPSGTTKRLGVTSYNSSGSHQGVLCITN